MTFKHKLSCRLALMRDRWMVLSTVALALAALAACEKPISLTGPDTSAVLRLVISPKVLTLRPHQVADFTAVGLTSTGVTGSTHVSWSVTSGSMTDTSTTGDQHYARYQAGADAGAAKVVVSGRPGGIADTAIISVMPAPVASVAVSPATMSVQVGGTVQLAAATKDSAGNPLSGRAVAWMSSNPAIAAASPSGLVTAVAAGAATITATSEGKSGTASVTVTTLPPPPPPPPAPVATVTVSPASASLTVGQSVQLNATLKDASGNVLNGRTVSWASGTSGVATVSGSGLVTGVAAGTATITATSEGVGGSVAMTVTTPATPPASVGDLAVVGTTSGSVTLSFTEVSDGAGQPANYEIRYAPGAMSWGSAPSVTSGTCATPVTGSLIGAKRTCTVLGLAAATAYAFELVAYRGTLGQGATFGALSNVVTASTGASTAPVAGVTVSPATATVTVGQTLQLSATLLDGNGNVLTGRPISWATSVGVVATVSGSGVVTGVAAGTATITATAEGKSGASVVTASAPSLGGTFPNEPSGYTRILWYNGNCILGAGCGEIGQWAWSNGYAADAANIASVSVADAPTSALDPLHNVLQTTFPAGQTPGYAPLHLYGWNSISANQQYREIYVSFWIKLVGTDYEAYPGVNKFGFFGYGSGTGVDYSNDGFFDLRPPQQGGSQGVIVDHLNLQFQQQNHVSRQIVTSANISVGSWHRWEVVMKLNDLGAANGVLRWWQDGVLVADYSDVTYVTPGNTNGFYSYEWAPYWGGGSAGMSAKTRDDHVLTDQFHISGVLR